MRSFNRALRVCSLIVLFFFSWTYMPVYALVAYGAEKKQEAQGTRGQGPGSRVQRSARPEERFEKALDGIRENVSRAEEKADKGEDDKQEREAIKAKRAEIESADVEFKKEFAATEKKLKEAKLPKEILDRHAKFVKNYTANLKELRANLDGVEQAKTRSDRRAKIEKTRLHLEKVKTPAKHQKLDPNNLPFRARKSGKTREPRLKQEEFEKDFPSKKKTRTAFNLQDLLAADSRRSTQISGSNSTSAPYRKPILVASNGSLTGLLASNNQLPLTALDKLPLPSVGEGWGEGAVPQFAFADSPSFLLAQAGDAPTTADLASTPEIQVNSPLIHAKAQDLGCSPVKLYEWTRNEIFSTPTHGAIQGAEMCLQTKECNAVDTNALLVALFRSCNIPARLNIGTIELSIEKVMNWAGGFTDPAAALNYLASGGIPVTGLRSGGKIYAAKLETEWVRAFVDYIPSFGAVQKEGDTWIPLDASYKQYTYTDGIDLQAAVPFDAQNLIDQLKTTATIKRTGKFRHERKLNRC